MTGARVPLSGEWRHVGCHMEGFVGLSPRPLIHRLLRTSDSFSFQAWRYSGLQDGGRQYARQGSLEDALSIVRIFRAEPEFPTDLDGMSLPFVSLHHPDHSQPSQVLHIRTVMNGLNENLLPKSIHARRLSSFGRIEIRGSTTRPQLAERSLLQVTYSSVAQGFNSHVPKQFIPCRSGKLAQTRRPAGGGPCESMPSISAALCERGLGKGRDNCFVTPCSNCYHVPRCSLDSESSTK